MSEDWKNQQEDASDEEEEEIEDASYKTPKDAVLFAIEVSESMLRKPDHVDSKKPDMALSPTAAALKCAYNLMQQRIISNPNDMMGILLFGTEQSKFQDEDTSTGKSALQYPHCYLLTDLDVPAAADVKQLRNLVEDEEEAAELLQASKEEVNMASVLFCSNQIFTTKAPNFTSRRLFLVTDNDLPHASDPAARASAATRAKDLYDLGVTIDLFPISHPDRNYTFDRSKFYDDIVYSSTPADPDAPEPLQQDVGSVNSSAKDGISLLEALLSSINSRATPKRANFSNVPFEIGPGLKISVKGYIMLKRQEPKRTSYVHLSPETDKAQIAVLSSSMVAEDTARTVQKAEIRRAFKFGGDSISFSEEELAKIKSFGDPVIRIIGFKPLSMIPIWANMKHPTFIYPSEEGFIGSTRVFAALHAKLLKDKKVGIAWYIPRRNASPRLAALIPGSETRNEDTGTQTMPPGIWVKTLPFADDVRQPPDLTVVRAPDTVTDAMRVIIQQLQLPKGIYDPQKYPNPSLQWFYKILQALALEEDLPEKPEDKTLPRYKQIHKRAGGYVQDFGEILDKEFEAWQKEQGGMYHPTANGGTKRSAGAGGSSKSSDTAAKKVKKENGDEDEEPALSDEQMRKAYEKDQVAKFKVAELKGWLGGKGAKTSGKKADLVDEVTRWFETKMEVD